MLTLGLTGRIWLCVDPIDGRKSYDGLAGAVTTHLAGDPLSGDLFVFKNRRGDRLKILAWQGDGFAIKFPPHYGAAADRKTLDDIAARLRKRIS